MLSEKGTWCIGSGEEKVATQAWEEAWEQAKEKDYRENNSQRL